MAKQDRSEMIDKHIAALKGLEGKSVDAGWFETNTYGGTAGVPVAKVARIQEFGATITKTSKTGKTKTITIPSRPFMRFAWANFSANRNTLQTAIARKILNGLSADKALGQIGNELENCIADSIKNGNWAPNSPETIKRKGPGLPPLFHSGIMFKTLTSKVNS